MQHRKYSNNRIFIALAIEICFVILSLFLSISYGSKSIPFGDTMSYFTGGMADEFLSAVIAARIPRTVFGLLAGAALGVSGALMQAITRNPIADPSILGVNTGAALFVVVGIAYLNISSGIRLIGISFAGALLTALLQTLFAASIPVTAALLVVMALTLAVFLYLSIKGKTTETTIPKGYIAQNEESIVWNIPIELLTTKKPV